MKRASTSSRKVRTGDRKSFARPSTQVRRRAAEFKLESLEERTLLSTLADQGDSAPQRAARPWHGLHDALRAGSRRGAPDPESRPVHRRHDLDQASTPPETMAQLEAYLKKLKIPQGGLTNAGGGVPRLTRTRLPPWVPRIRPRIRPTPLPPGTALKIITPRTRTTPRTSCSASTRRA